MLDHLVRCIIVVVIKTEFSALAIFRQTGAHEQCCAYPQVHSVIGSNADKEHVLPEARLTRKKATSKNKEDSLPHRLVGTDYVDWL